MIDTNVLVKANNSKDDVPQDCFEACLNALKAARSYKILLDSEYRILSEYTTYMSHSGQPGVGDAFFKWLFENQANVEHCGQVHITPLPGLPEDYEEFPRSADLTSFDKSDRKFVAVAVASKASPPILNAGDRGWRNYRDALERNNVRLVFLCAAHALSGE